MKVISIENNTIDLSEFETSETEFTVNFNKEFDFDIILSLSDRILDWEEKSDQKKHIFLNFKGLPDENLILMYKHYFQRESLVNEYLIVNMNILINGYNTLDDQLFESSIIYECDLEQLLDVKMELGKEIKAFQSSLTKWFLAGVKSLHKVEYTYLDKTVKMPMIYNKIISSSNLLTLSQIFSKAISINTDELPLVEGAYPIIMSAVSTSAIANKLVQSIDINI